MSAKSTSHAPRLGANKVRRSPLLPGALPGPEKKEGRSRRSGLFIHSDQPFRWCRRGESNPRPQPYQGCALPLSYGGGSLRKRPYSQRFWPGQAKNACLIKIFGRGLLQSWISRQKTPTGRGPSPPFLLQLLPPPRPRPSGRRDWPPPCVRICVAARRRARAARARPRKATESHPSCDVPAFRLRRQPC